MQVSVVTPLAGVWIEIILTICVFLAHFVTPLAGVWIEISAVTPSRALTSSHTPRGCVD